MEHLHMATFTDRLLFLVEDLASGKAAPFAKKAGIPQGTFHNYVKGRLPNVEHLIAIAETYKVDMNWLLTGGGGPYRCGPEHAVGGASRTKCLSAEEYFLLPLLQSWVKGGPEGRIISEGVADHYPFKRHFIERLVGTSLDRYKDLYLARVKGDSMAPTINDSEIILFDTHENERIQVRTGDIYLVQLPEGTVSVKRLSLSIEQQGAKLVCHSDNVVDYKMFDFQLAPGRPIQSYVLGRVRWAGKEFD